MAVGLLDNASKFYEATILLKDGTPSVTWYGSPAVQNGSEQRSLQDCIKAIEKILPYVKTDWGIENDIEYKIFKYSVKIQELSQDARKLVEEKQVNVLRRFFYHIQACFSWIFSAPEAKVTNLLQKAFPTNGDIDLIRQNHIKAKKIKLAARMLDAETKAKAEGWLPEFQQFKTLFEELIPEDQRSLERFLVCAWMERWAIGFIGSHTEAELKWDEYLRNLVITLPYNSKALSWLYGKVNRWSQNSAAASGRWLQALRAEGWLDFLKHCSEVERPCVLALADMRNMTPPQFPKFPKS